MTYFVARDRVGIARRFTASFLLGDSDQCWEWRGYRTIKGYGSIGAGEFAHRVAYELLVGPIPPKLYVLHHCDNPPCVNPSHLFLGTIADNNRDMVEKGRGFWQENAPHNRLGRQGRKPAMAARQ